MSMVPCSKAKPTAKWKKVCFMGPRGWGREGGEPKYVLVEPLARPYFWAIPPIGPVICTNLKHKRRPTDTNQTNAQNRSSQSPRGLGGLGSPDRESAATREVAGGALLFAMGLPVTYSREVAMLEATGSAVGGSPPKMAISATFTVVSRSSPMVTPCSRTSRTAERWKRSQPLEPWKPVKPPRRSW